MSGASTLLNFDPVSCIVSLILDDTEDSRIYGLTAESRVAYRADGSRQHFSVVHGSLVMFGQPDNVARTVPAAVVLELPCGRRRRATGTAELRYTGMEDIHAKISAQTDDGEVLMLSVRCNFAEHRATPQSMRCVQN